MLKGFLVALALVTLGTAAQADAVGPRFQVNTYKKSQQYRSAVTALAGGGFVVTWMSDGQDGSYSGIFGQRYNNSASPVGVQFQVNTSWKQQQVGPSVAGLADGGFIITWQSSDASERRAIFGQRYDAAGKRKGVEFGVSKTAAEDQRLPSVAGLRDGGFVVVWFLENADSSASIDSSTIVGQRFTATGVRAGGQFKVGNAVQDSFSYSSPQVGQLANGGFVVTWVSQTSSAYYVYARRYNANGAPAGSNLKVAAVSANDTQGVTGPRVVGLQRGRFVVVWNDFNDTTSRAGTFGRRYTSDGLAAGSKFKINTTAGSHHSAVAALASGGFVVTYVAETSNFAYGVFGQHYSEGALPIGGEFSVGAPPAGLGQRDPSAAGLQNGGFVFTWTDREPVFENSDGIFGQRYSP
jgi:hypothetical protein